MQTAVFLLDFRKPTYLS